MLKISPTARSRPVEIPRGLTTLSVSWLNGQFKALAVQRGVVEGTWERPGELEGTGNFEALLREAVQKTGYHGLTVSLLLAHPRLVQQLVEVPPVKGSALKKVIHRQAQQQKMFDGEAACAFQPSLSDKGSKRVVLHLFPKLLLDQLVQGAHRNELHLTSVLPPSAVLHYQMAQLPLEKEEIALLAAETGGSTTVVIGRSDGQVLLARTLPGSWNEAAERLAVDLNRTILFVNQQYGVAINKGVWLFGPGATEQSAAMQRHIQLPVKPSPVAYQPFYWATEAVKLTAELTPNFISVEMQKAPQQRVFAQVVGAGTAGFVLASLAASAFLILEARQETANIRTLTAREAELQAQHKEFQQKNIELARKEQRVKLVIDHRPPPVPGWFLGYLSEVLPPDLVVTNLVTKREADLWKVQLTGTLQATGNPPAPAALSNSVALLTSRLVNGPFHLRLPARPGQTGDSAPANRGGAGNTFASWAARLTESPAAAKAAPAGMFVIEGVMQ